METVLAGSRHHALDSWILLLSGARLGHSDQLDHGDADISFGPMVHSNIPGASMESLAGYVFCYVVHR